MRPFGTSMAGAGPDLSGNRGARITAILLAFDALCLAAATLALRRGMR